LQQLLLAGGQAVHVGESGTVQFTSIPLRADRQVPDIGWRLEVFMNKLLICFVLGVVLTGCSGKEPEPDAKAEHKALYKAVDAPLQKAKGVEDQVLQQAEEQKRQIDRQLEGGEGSGE
jgi:hypothetical protein